MRKEEEEGGEEGGVRRGSSLCVCGLCLYLYLFLYLCLCLYVCVSHSFVYLEEEVIWLIDVNIQAAHFVIERRLKRRTTMRCVCVCVCVSVSNVCSLFYYFTSIKASPFTYFIHGKDQKSKIKFISFVMPHL